MEWPDWELRAHGSAASGLGPWFSARLTFPDGARIDVLVTASGDHLAVEDVRADPPLTLDALATLAHWIEGPLDDTCRAATGRPPKSRPAPAAAPHRHPGPAAPAAPRSAEAADAAPGAAADGAVGGVPGEAAADAAEGAVDDPGNEVRGEAGKEAAGEASAVAPAAAAPPQGPGTDPEPQSEAASPSSAPRPEQCAPSPEPSERSGASERSGVSEQPGVAEPPPAPAAAVRSAVLVRSRAGERRRIAAAAYRAAQKEGRDPVLAVMHATGRNRRRALRLIAGARDAGLLTPRHNKR
ncbi:hypothetical protein ADL22_00670 [Streptomyces sp. NRRL F-4489]|uniref:DUF6214 family protein n=1 Tax=Streptomyces sp. NRRL F-4489 TaxID=1609095 RepID=UPI00074933D4|nr:hypothetical protein ADL22_00670 [Streptomyces sp. NRRL F-4489]